MSDDENQDYDNDNYDNNNDNNDNDDDNDDDAFHTGMMNHTCIRGYSMDWSLQSPKC